MLGPESESRHHSWMLSQFAWLLSGFISKGRIRMWFLELFEVDFAGHIHLNAVSAPAYKTGQHFTTHLQQAALDRHNKSPRRLSMSTKQTLFQKLLPNL